MAGISIWHKMLSRNDDYNHARHKRRVRCCLPIPKGGAKSPLHVWGGVPGEGRRKTKSKDKTKNRRINVFLWGSFLWGTLVASQPESLCPWEPTQVASHKRIVRGDRQAAGGFVRNIRFRSDILHNQRGGSEDPLKINEQSI